MFSNITHNLHTIANFDQAARIWSRGYDHSQRRGRVGSHWSHNELRETLQRKEKEDLAFNPQALVDKLTLPQARQLYDLLRRYLSV